MVGIPRLDEVQRHLERGAVTEAAAALARMSAGGPAVETLRRKVRNLVLRKLQRQGKAEAFQREAGADATLALAAARLDGPAALAALAADPRAAPRDRLLASAGAGEIKVGLQALRSESDLRAIAEGWLLLLRGDAAAALEAFTRAPVAQARRAQVGAAVALTVAGRPAEALARWEPLGPFPQLVLPTASAFGQQLAAAALGLDAAGLRTLVLSGTAAELERALGARPTQGQRAWICLRLGDALWRAEADRPAPTRSRSLWAEAARLDAGLRVDALKRLAAAQLRAAEEASALIELHTVLAARDRQAARRAVDAFTADLDVECLSRIPIDPDSKFGYPRVTAKDPVEWQYVWLRVAVALPPDGFLADLQPKISDQRQVLQRLEAAYDEDAVFLRFALDWYARCGTRSDQRKASFRYLIATRDRDQLSYYLSALLADGRAHRQAARELTTLDRCFPHDYDLGLAWLQTLPKQRDALVAIAAGMSPALAEVFRWETGLGGPPPATQIGSEDEADRRLAFAFDRLPGPAADYADRLLADRSRLHRLLLPLGGTTTSTRLRLAKAWIDHDPADWRGHYQLGRAHRFSAQTGPACAAYRAALTRMGGSEAEYRSIRKVLIDHDELVEPVAVPARTPLPADPAASPIVDLDAVARRCGMPSLFTLAGFATEAAALRSCATTLRAIAATLTPDRRTDLANALMVVYQQVNPASALALQIAGWRNDVLDDSVEMPF